MSDASSHKMLDIAKELASVAGDLDAAWEVIHFRFNYERSFYGSTASYIANDRVELLPPSSDKSIHYVNDIAAAIFDEVNKPKALMLVSVKRDMTFDVKFEYEDMSLWRISKFNGTGIPEGI